MNNRVHRSRFLSDVFGITIPNALYRSGSILSRVFTSQYQFKKNSKCVCSTIEIIFKKVAPLAVKNMSKYEVKY